MRETLNYIVFGWYPYLCLTVFLVGSLLRFDREQYTWRSGSSQLLRRRQLMWGSNLFHVGILVIFLGHFVGLLTPIWIFDTLGISHTFKQWMAIVVGGVAGIMCFVGTTLLVHRRLFDPRIRKTSSFGDIAILLLLYAQLILGLATIFVSLGHLDGHEMVKFMTWAQGILTLQPGVSALVADVHPIFKLHLFLGMTIFLVFPFTRLVHVWSAPIWYLGRRGYQVVRTRRSGSMPCPPAQRGPGGVIAMTCAVHQTVLPSGNGVKVNGVAIPRDAIAREVQHHPARSPAESLKAAARALVVRELLLQEARRLEIEAEPLADAEGRRETAEEAAVRALVDREVRTPTADVATCRRYYEQNRQRSAHRTSTRRRTSCLPPGRQIPSATRRRARTLRPSLPCCANTPSASPIWRRRIPPVRRPRRAATSDRSPRARPRPNSSGRCSDWSRASIGPEPVATRYGFHIIRLDRKHGGRQLPFEVVAERIAEYLQESVQRRALAQYIARLATAARIEGVELATAEAMRVN